MEMNNFAQKVCAAVGEELGRGYEVKVQKVQKNNGICRTGILVMAKGANVVPTIYLEGLLAAYGAGMPFSGVVLQIIETYRRSLDKDGVDLEFFRDFGKVQDRICYKLIGKKKNEALLEGIPHMEFLDLAICFYYAYNNNGFGEGGILIHNSHMEMWHTCTTELFRLAQENTPRLFPWRCGTVWEMLQEGAQAGGEECGGGAGLEEGSFDDIPMKVLTNSKRSYGGVAILYPGVLEEVAERMGGDFYIIPSSIHEVILLPCDERHKEEFLKGMIADVNRTQVEPEEVLSDSLYYYDAVRKETRVL